MLSGESAIIDVREKVYSFVNSRDFRGCVEKTENDYFMDKYFEYLVNYTVGGKCIRAYLVDLGYKLAKGVNCEVDIKACTSYELFEAGILAHDDIIDRSCTRRGIPSMYMGLGGDHLGISRAICLGDAAMFLANALLLQTDYDDVVIRKAVDNQNKIFLYTVSGELMDINLSASDVYLEDDVIDMYYTKTSWYTFIGPLSLGAILGKGSHYLLDRIQEIGLLIGVAFQIKDDILGIFGTEEAVGKSVFSDAQEGKKSILTSYFDANSTVQAKQDFYSIYGKDVIRDEEMDFIKSMLINSGSLEYAKSYMANCIRKTFSIIDKSDFDLQQKHLITDFCKYIVDRER